MILIIDYLTVLSSLTFLIYGSWSDLKTRQVSNKIWAIFFPIAIFCTLIRIYFRKNFLLISSLSIFIIIIISLIGFYSGMMGGADSKAYICIGIAMPIYPSFVNCCLHPFFPLSVFINSYLISSAVFFYSILRNIFWIANKKESLFLGFENEVLWKKILVFISGYKMSLNDLGQKIKYFHPIEEVTVKDGILYRNLRILTRIESIDPQSLHNLITKYPNTKLPTYIWVTSLLPMIVFIALGYIITIFACDIFSVFMQISYI